MTQFKTIHDPNAKKPYGFDLSLWLDTGDSVSSVEWSISPTGPTLSSPTIDGDSVYTWIEDAILGNNYRLIADWVTTNGIEDRRSIAILCRNR